MAEKKRFSKAVLSHALKATIPVMAGYIVLGIGYGVLMATNGFSTGWSVLCSLIIYGGSLQYASVSLLASQASILTTAITSFAIHARHLFYGISMYDTYSKADKKVKPYLIFGLTDETYSLLCTKTVPDGDDPDTYRFLVTLLDQGWWVLGTLLGGIAGSVIPFDLTGIDFSMTALFTASFVSQWKSTKDHRSALIGLFTSVICLLLFGPDKFLIPSMVSMTMIFFLIRGKMTAHE